VCCGTRWPDASAAANATAESGATRVVSSRCFSASMRAYSGYSHLYVVSIVKAWLMAVRTSEY